MEVRVALEDAKGLEDRKENTLACKHIERRIWGE